MSLFDRLFRQPKSRTAETPDSDPRDNTTEYEMVEVEREITDTVWLCDCRIDYQSGDSEVVEGVYIQAHDDVVEFQQVVDADPVPNHHSDVQPAYYDKIEPITDPVKFVPYSSFQSITVINGPYEEERSVTVEEAQYLEVDNS